MMEHLKSFVGFYFKRRQVEIESPYDLRQSLSRIMTLNNKSEVRVTCTKRDRLIAVGAQHGASALGLPANILPVFEGSLEERNGSVTLRGIIGLDTGVRIILGIICFFVFIFFPVRIGNFAGDIPYFVAPLGLVVLLVLAYRFGRDDVRKITESLDHVLHEREIT